MPDERADYTEEKAEKDILHVVQVREHACAGDCNGGEQRGEGQHSRTRPKVADGEPARGEVIGRKRIIGRMRDERSYVLDDKWARLVNERRAQFHERNRRDPAERSACEIDSPRVPPNDRYNDEQERDGDSPGRYSGDRSVHFN